MGLRQHALLSVSTRHAMQVHAQDATPLAAVQRPHGLVSYPQLGAVQHASGLCFWG